MKPGAIRSLLIALLIGGMILLAVSGLCGQSFRTEAAPPESRGGYIDYVKGVYILYR